MKKRILTVPLVAIVAVCMVLLSACSSGPTAEELIKEDLAAQFDEVKKSDSDFLKGIESASGDSFEQLGVDTGEFAKAYLDGFDYKIGSVKVNEGKGTAKATVSVTCKSMAQIIDAFTAAVDAETDSMTSMSEDEIYKRCGALMMQATKDTKPKKTKCTFTYKLNKDNAWEADDSATDEMIDAMLS